VANILRKPPVYTSKSKHLYSNIGYTIAESLASRSWEDLIREEIFQPLGLDSAGFGPPKDHRNMLEQPREHQKSLFSRGGKSVTSEVDNTSIIGPAGSIYMSLLISQH